MKSIGKAKQDGGENHVSVKAINLFTELMVEANAQLQLITLPESTYGKYKELIKLTQYETIKQHWFGGEDPRLEFKREKIMAETMNETKVYKQLSDGSVPSFEKFKSVKDKI